MADLRSLFPILQDDATGAGEAPIARDEGEAAAGKAGLIGFSFKDASGNVVLPQLNNEGAIVVSSDAGTTIKGYGKVAGSASAVTVASITLALTKQYTKISANVSCSRDALMEIVHVDDVGVGDTETVLHSCIVGPGQFSFKMGLDADLLDTTGGTGTQELRIRGTNLNALSDLHGSLSANEIA